MGGTERPRLTITRSPADAARVTVDRVVEALRAARAERGVAHLALAGGRTPRAAYELLGPALGDWDGVHLWFGDERAVPPDDPESNARLVAEALLPGADVPAERVHRIRGELPPPEAAAAYEAELRATVTAGADGVPVLDLALLGLGEDGHTASLFPGDPAVARTDALAFAVRAAKPPPDRITLSLPVLRSARAALLLAEGEGKAWAVSRALAGPDPAIPASLLVPERTELVVDEAAASSA